MSKIRIRNTDGLIVVDLQPTFMPGGGLAVTHGDEIVDDVHELMNVFDGVYAKTCATLDRHPLGHISLASSYTGIVEMYNLEYSTVQRWTKTKHRIAPHARFSLEELKSYLEKVGSQILWPDHALEGEVESELYHDLDEEDFSFVQVKGMDPACDSYSGFYDNLRRSTGLKKKVEAAGIKRLFICGLAFDFCVGWTALDARKAFPKMEIFVIEKACRSVNMPGTVEAMKGKLAAANVRLTKSNFWS